ncbi:hypothetical protein FJR05_09945 [Dolichospermum sp. UHCC 0259]|nr:hypothetical protein [Dolichospermum sp. UHCC 0259]
MGANEFNPESTPESSYGDYRVVDEGIEESGSLLARVRAEQCRFEAGINSLAVAVSEYALLLADVRKFRVERVKERDIRFEGKVDGIGQSYEEVDYGYSGVREVSTQNQNNREGGFSL